MNVHNPVLVNLAYTSSAKCANIYYDHLMRKRVRSRDVTRRIVKETDRYKGYHGNME